MGISNYEFFTQISLANKNVEPFYQYNREELIKYIEMQNQTILQ